jgi:ribonuclease HI
LPFGVGAEVGSNNTGELCGILEALLWARDHWTPPPSATTPSENRPVVEVRYDSEYAKKVVTGEYRAAKNVALVQRAKRALRAASIATGHGHNGSSGSSRSGGGSFSGGIEVRFLHVKGHSSDFWNDRADELAKQGAAGRVCAVGRWAALTAATSTSSSAPPPSPSLAASCQPPSPLPASSLLPVPVVEVLRLGRVEPGAVVMVDASSDDESTLASERQGAASEQATAGL